MNRTPFPLWLSGHRQVFLLLAPRDPSWFASERLLREDASAFSRREAPPSRGKQQGIDNPAEPHRVQGQAPG